MNKIKKRLLLYIILVMLLITGCKKTEIEDENNLKNTGGISEQGDEPEAESEKTLEELLGEVDMEQSHINLKLSKNVMIDADITQYSQYKDGLNLYRINDITDEENSEKGFVKALDDFFGKDVTITIAEQEQLKKETKEEVDFTCVYDRLFQYYFESYKYGDCLNSLSVYRIAIPFYKNNYDKKFVDGIIEKVLTEFSKEFLIDVSDDYECIWVNSEYYAKTEDFIKKIIPSQYSDVKPNLKDYFEDETCQNKEEYYIVRLMQRKDGGIELDNIMELPFKLSEFGVMETKGTGILRKREDAYCVTIDNDIRILFTADGSIRVIEIRHNANIEDTPFESVQVKNIQEMLSIIYDQYKYSIEKEDEVEIFNMELKYMGALHKDDAGNVITCIKPYWVIQFYDKRESYESSRQIIIYDAVTGKVALNML